MPCKLSGWFPLLLDKHRQIGRVVDEDQARLVGTNHHATLEKVC